jgi:hypothetical protein
MTYSRLNEGTGELETYVDAFKDVTDEQVQLALQTERQILAMANGIHEASLNLGYALQLFRDAELYKARGYETFDLWADSAEMANVGKQTAKYLIRIVENIVPILENTDNLPSEYPVSTLRAMLPLLAEERGEELVVEAAESVKGLTCRDAAAIIKEMRGVGTTSDDEPDVIKAYVTMGETEHKVETYMFRADGSFTHLGDWVVSRKDYALVGKMFGKNLEVRG